MCQKVFKITIGVRTTLSESGGARLVAPLFSCAFIDDVSKYIMKLHPLTFFNFGAFEFYHVILIVNFIGSLPIEHIIAEQKLYYKLLCLAHMSLLTRDLLLL